MLHETRVLHASNTFKSRSVATTAWVESASKDRLAFWAEQARQLTWYSPWKTVLDWNRPYAKWFVEGTLNASVNCLDVHMGTERETKPAIIWEGELGTIRRYTYAELHDEVDRFSRVLSHQFKVRRGDRVTIYMPLIPELVVAVLACARIGAIHSVVFGGFSSQSLKDRILDSDSKIVITATGGYRRGKVIPLKEIVDAALPGTAIRDVIVVNHAAADTASFIEGRDFRYNDLMAKEWPEFVPEQMNSEDPLFILYTSGTTGKPKGIVHTTGGYLTHAKYSTRIVFDLKDDDIYWCTADIGWITGHTYVVYGPLSNGATVLLYEGSPDYPDKDRFWSIIAQHKISILYTAPTAIRAFMKWGDHFPNRHDLSSLRLLGSVGEPINPEAWMWYYEVIGKSRCPIVDTWWQTETGGIMVTALPGIAPMKPGTAGPALPGISIDILDDDGHPSTSGLLSITEPWPSMARGIWGDNSRFESTYWAKFPTYFAGDGATVDADGYITVLGRVDDVLNVAGHRIGTMEVESALVDFESIAEAAVVGIPDDIKGQAILAFAILKEGVTASAELEAAAINWVGDLIGAIAKPKRIVFTPDLPKTRSGKIMRRVLKGIANNEPTGDTTTLANPDIVEALRGIIAGN